MYDHLWVLTDTGRVEQIDDTVCKMQVDVDDSDMAGHGTGSGTTIGR